LYAGYRKIEVTDDEKNISFPVFLMYPTDTPSKITNLDPFTVDATPEAAVTNGLYPLVIISHGGGGNYLGYLTIAQYLAQNTEQEERGHSKKR